MEEIRQFASMLCIAAVGCCMLKMLLPESTMEPVLKVVLSAFFLLCLLTPLRGIAPSLSAAPALLEGQASPSTQSLTQAYNRQIEKAVADNLEAVISAKLEGMGISGANICINVNMDDGGRIDITGVEIAVDGEYAPRAREIEDYVTRELELPCVVEAIGEEKGNGY